MNGRNKIYKNCILPFLKEHLRVEGFPFDNHYQLPNYVFNRYHEFKPEVPPKDLGQLNTVVVEAKHLVCASQWFAQDIAESDSFVYWKGAKHLPSGYVRSLILILTEYDKYEMVQRYFEKNAVMRTGPEGRSMPYLIRGHLSTLLDGSAFVGTLMIVDTYPDSTASYHNKLTFDLQEKFKFQKVQNALVNLDQKESFLCLLTDEEVDVLDDMVSEWVSEGIYGDSTHPNRYEKRTMRRTKMLLRLAHVDLMTTALAPLISARLCARANPMPISFPTSFNWSTTDALEPSKDAKSNDAIRDVVTRFVSRWLKIKGKLKKISGVEQYTLPPIQERTFEWAFVIRPAELLLNGEIPPANVTEK